MYQPNESFTLPPDESAKIWRYLDFCKFVSLLDTQSLYFARASKLSESDPYEFNIPVATRRKWESHLPAHKQEMPRLMHDLFQKSIYISCWHTNEYESAAMWKQYVKSNEGIAVQSTVRRLVDSFTGYPEDVLIGQVRYIDYDSEEIAFDDKIFKYALFKRRSFTHENELRAVICRQDIREEEGNRFVVAPDSEGIVVPVCINRLVESVYVASEAEAWVLDLVRRIAAKYGLNEVRPSCLGMSPVS